MTFTSLEENVWLDRAFAVVSIAVLALTMTTIRHREVNASPYIDFNLYYFGAQVEKQGSYTDDAAVLQKEKAYKPGQYSADGVFGAPALVAFVYMPLSSLSIHHAQVVWDVAMAVLLLLGVRSAARKHWPIYLIALLLTGATLSSLQYGNAATLTFALTAFAYGALRDKKRWVFAISMGLAIAFKAYPVLFLVALVPLRQWKLSAGTLATALIVHLAAIPVLGFGDWIKATHRLFGLTKGHHIWPDNGSIPGIVDFSTGNHLLSTAISVVLVAATVGLLLKLRFQKPQQAFAFAAVLTIIAQPISWPFYFMLVLLLMIGFTEVQKSPILLVAGWVLYFISTILSVDINGAPSWYAPGMPKLVGLLVLLILFVHMFRQRETPTPA